MLNGERIIIKPLEKKYLEDVRRLRNHRSVHAFLTTTSLITKKMQEVWFKKLQTDKSRLYFTIHLLDDTFIGIIRSDQWDKVNLNIRIGMDIREDYRGHGYAKEGYRYYLKYLFEDLHMHRVWLEVLDFNSIARSLYNKLGFKKEGVLREAVYRERKYHDYIVMSLLKHEYEKKYKT